MGAGRRLTRQEGLQRASSTDHSLLPSRATRAMGRCVEQRDFVPNLTARQRARRPWRVKKPPSAFPPWRGMNSRTRRFWTRPIRRPSASTFRSELLGVLGVCSSCPRSSGPRGLLNCLHFSGVLEGRGGIQLAASSPGESTNSSRSGLG